MAFYSNNIKHMLMIFLSTNYLIILLNCIIFLSEEAISSSVLLSSSAPIVPDSSSGEFLIKFQIGTPPVQVFGIADITTDLTWIQCSNSSNNNNNNIFDPKKSKTFRNVSCGSDQCGLVDTSICNEEQQPCDFRSYYDGDGVSTFGEVAAETFTLDKNSNSNNNSNNNLAIFPEVMFGCGRYKNVGGGGIYTGVVGLGRGPSSVVRQFGDSKFSYCLTSSNNNSNSNNVTVEGKIRFGRDAVVPAGPNVVSTPLKEGYLLHAPGYYVRLEGISVGNKRLEFNDTPAAPTRFGNIVFDSRATNTMLPSGFYDLLENALAGAIASKRVPDPREGAAGLCYAAASPVNFPALTVHFEGADLVLPRGSVFAEVVESKGVVCLTFSRTIATAYPVFGNMHQRNILIGFDLDNRKVDFLPTDCAKPQ
ncbi:hypothetical protein ABFS83_14G026200 [Erythranthe nasuta]